MKCPCGHTKTKVTYSTPVGEFVRRRRLCLLCGLRFSTYEEIAKATEK